MSNLPPIFIVVITFGLLFVTLNSFVLGLKMPVGRLIARFVQEWQLSVWVVLINFVLLPALIIGFVLTVGTSIPGDVKAGFCVAGLAAGAPFAPLFTRLAKGDVHLSGSLMMVLMVLTILSLTIGLPPAVAAVDPARPHLVAWNVAWPLLLFLLLPLVLGCLFRLRWAEAAAELAHWLNPLAILCLLVHVTLYFVAAWSAFQSAWGTGTYLAALAIPVLGLLCGYLLVSILRIKDSGTRHAAEITTGQRGVSAGLLMCLFPLGAYPLVSVSFLACSIIAIVLLLVFSLEWGRALATKGAEVVAAESAGAERTGEGTIPHQLGGEAMA